MSLLVGPIIVSDEARDEELDMSLLERLFERPVYAKHPQARQNLRFDAEEVDLDLLPAPPGLLPPPSKNYVPFVNLVRVSAVISF
jgi:hypothetical protein